MKPMEVHFTPEQQAQLAQMATKAGTNPERLVTNVVVRYLDEKARFLEAVEKESRQRNPASLSKKKKWMRGLSACSSPDDLESIKDYPQKGSPHLAEPTVRTIYKLSVPLRRTR